MARIIIELILLTLFIGFITKDSHHIVQGIVGLIVFVLWVKSLDKRG